MNEEQKLESVDDVLDAFAAVVDDPEQLKEWTGRYPQFGRELTEFALHHTMAEYGPEPDVSPDEDHAFMARAMSIVGSILGEQATVSVAAQAPLKDLLTEGKARGLNARGLARTLRVTPAMITRLNRRMVRYASIPRQLVLSFAQALERDVGEIAAYLQAPPTLALGANYKSEGVPVLGEPQDFYDALFADEELDEDDRAHWSAQHTAGTERNP